VTRAPELPKEQSDALRVSLNERRLTSIYLCTWPYTFSRAACYSYIVRVGDRR